MEKNINKTLTLHYNRNDVIKHDLLQNQLCFTETDGGN